MAYEHLSKKKLIELLNELLSNYSVTNGVDDTYAKYIRKHLPWSNEQEIASILFLNRKLHILGHEILFKGIISGVTIDKRLILKKALTKPGCCTIILCHNHPTGDIEPSQSDMKFTNDLKIACNQIGIALLDSIIYSQTQYKSILYEEKAD